MTDEYISRDKLMDIVGNMPTCWEYGQAVSDIYKIVKGMPAADVAPVVHGQWIYHDDGVVTCSKCGNAESSDSYYCRGCGAKMDGGSDNGK